MVTAFRPVDLREALAIRAGERTIVFAGGSDLMVRGRSIYGGAPRFDLPVLMVGHLPELIEITLDGGILTIGPCCTLSRILCHEAVPSYVRAPLLGMASPPVRNIATLGGNICNASPAGDSLPMLYALDARIELRATDRIRTLKVSDFITGPGRTLLKEDEILTGISIPLADYSRVCYRKVGTRRANGISKVSLFAAAKLSASRVEALRISLGAVAPMALRSRVAENMLESLPLEAVARRVDAVKDCFASLINPIDDMRSSKEYRRTVAFNLLENYLCNLISEEDFSWNLCQNHRGVSWD